MSSVTVAPTPTSFTSTTHAPSPTTYTSTTHAPSPTTYTSTTRNPTPSSFDPDAVIIPTYSPTYSDSHLTATQVAIISTTVIVIFFALIFYFYYSQSSNKETEISNTNQTISETAPLISEEAPKSDDTEAATESDSAFDKALGEGVVVNLHTLKGPRPVKLTMSGTELRWESMNLMTRKRYSIDLKEILFVEWGKQTHNFRKTASAQAPEQHCFSLMSQTTTLDIEASSKTERDMLAQGFTSFIDSLKSKRTASS